ncbi:hypothetical protein DCS_03440 [Drechmeria coniospora]|uniref:Uncharacterized protein n=1 Tax=Drechmeria coniospora TaxID=98403 RepID=A0A151GH59_DRECN|nr:hypothetical protein DCS_03440 [Drechmeria coniospora]KYK56440.1 hypothetical protein DCS_03440 [Drechmeria coniospora]
MAAPGLTTSNSVRTNAAFSIPNGWAKEHGGAIKNNADPEEYTKQMLQDEGNMMDKLNNHEEKVERLPHGPHHKGRLGKTRRTSNSNRRGKTRDLLSLAGIIGVCTEGISTSYASPQIATDLFDEGTKSKRSQHRKKNHRFDALPDVFTTVPPAKAGSKTRSSVKPKELQSTADNTSREWAAFAKFSDSRRSSDSSSPRVDKRRSNVSTPFLRNIRLGQGENLPPIG